MNKLSSLVGNDYPIMTYGLDTSTTTISTNLSSLTDEKEAVEDILSTIKTNMDIELLSKESSLSGTLTTFGNYGTSNVAEWNIEQFTVLVSGPPVSVSPPTSAEYSGNVTSLFTSGRTIVPDNGADGMARCTVVSSTYDSGTTTLIVSGGMITSNLTDILTSQGIYGKEYIIINNSDPLKDSVEFVDETTFKTTHQIPIGTYIDIDGSTSYIVSAGLDNTYFVNGVVSSTVSVIKLINGSLWDSDVSITKNISDFDFAYDHIYQPFGTTGTYGIQAKINAMSGGNTVITNNKNKQTYINTMYKQYSSWSVLPGTPEYIAENSFAYPGNTTSTFTYDRNILINCGVDKDKGVKINTSEYIPTSASSYTECTIVNDILEYSDTEDVNPVFDDTMLTMQVSGGSLISGCVYQDVVTFLCPGDQTSILTEGVKLIGTFNVVSITRYFKVLQSVLQSNPLANKTIITIKDGLPITENISTISIVVE